MDTQALDSATPVSRYPSSSGGGMEEYWAEEESTDLVATTRQHSAWIDYMIIMSTEQTNPFILHLE